MVPHPPVPAPHSGVSWNAHSHRFAGWHVMVPSTWRRMATAEMGLRGAHHPTPFLTLLTPGLLNHAAGAQRGLVILPNSLVLIFSFPTDAVKAHGRLAPRQLAVPACALSSAVGPESL